MGKWDNSLPWDVCNRISCNNYGKKKCVKTCRVVSSNISNPYVLSYAHCHGPIHGQRIFTTEVE